MAEQFATYKTIASIRSYHNSIPCSRNRIELRWVYLDKAYSVNLGPETEKPMTVDWEDCQLYMGNIKDCLNEHSDVLVTFMKASKTNLLSWPASNPNDAYWVSVQHIMHIIRATIA